MSYSMQGISGVDLRPGDYTIGPSEWRQDVGQALSNLGSGSEGDGEPMWHLYNVETANGRRVLEVVEDRRAMEGTFDTSGQKFLIRSPDEQPLMVFERESAMVQGTMTLYAIGSGDSLGSWESTSAFSTNWELRDANGDPRATFERQWSLGALLYPKYRIGSVDGGEIGQFEMNQDGLFREAELTLKRSSIPPEITLAFACGVFWAMNQS